MAKFNRNTRGKNSKGTIKLNKSSLNQSQTQGRALPTSPVNSYPTSPVGGYPKTPEEADLQQKELQRRANNINKEIEYTQVQDPGVDDATNYDVLERLEINNNIEHRIIPREFGGDNDFIELHLFDAAGNRLSSVHDFTQYDFPPNSGETTKEIHFDPKRILDQMGYTFGKYKIILNFQRQTLFKISKGPDVDNKLFNIKSISSDRTEITAISPFVSNNLLESQVQSYIEKIESSLIFQDFTCNFNQNRIALGINLGVGLKSKRYELLIKLYEPLDNTVGIGDRFNVTEDIMDPISFDLDLGEPEPVDESIPLRGPNFRADTRLLSSIPSSYKSYNEILEYNVTSSYQNLVNSLENTEIPEIQYDYIKPINDTGSLEVSYHFDNFVHFGSATERLKNFEYKLKLLEIYDHQISDINTIGGATSESVAVRGNKNTIKDKKTNLIKAFDGYERFLYYASGTYSWPKGDTTLPFTQRSVTSSEAKIWLGSDISSNPYYGGQLLSSSLFDRQNSDNLLHIVPRHILENDENSQAFLFLNMIGQHFDSIWTYIHHMTKQKNNSHKFGVSKNLVSFALKSLGIETFDQFENTGLIEYILGEGTSGSAFYGTTHHYSSSGVASETLITASNDGSISKQDITKETYKRLFHNAPYLLKHKGTERGIKALMSCYGLPSTILNIKEYGGPNKDRNTTTSFSHDKYTLALTGDTTSTSEFFIQTPWNSSTTNALSSSAKTVEVRTKPYRSTNPASTYYSRKYHIFGLSGSVESNDTHLILAPHTSSNTEGAITDISSSGDGITYGKLQLMVNNTIAAETNNFPVYNGDFWNVYIGTLGTSGSAANLEFGAYQSNFNKHISYVKSTYSMSELQRSRTWGDPYYNGGSGIGGSKFAFLGGMPLNSDATYNTLDRLRYSGSFQELRYHFGELLSHETLKKHALDSLTYSGNSVSSSYENLVLRLPLGSNLIKNSESFHPAISGAKSINYLAAGSNISSSISIPKYTSHIETIHSITPDIIAITSDKIRIDTGSVDDNMLSLNIMSTTPTTDRIAEDYEDLGIFFSPTNEINEDILNTLGNFRLDDYIGSPLPADQNSNSYKHIGISNTGNSLNELQDLYFKKYRKGKDKYDYRDYIKLIQYMDHTLFKIIEQHVPARTNLKTGILIEPHYLERNKFSRNLPTTDEFTTMLPQSHQHFQAVIETGFIEGAAVNVYSDIGPTQRKLLQKSTIQDLITIPATGSLTSGSNYGRQSSGSRMHGASTLSEFKIDIMGDYVLDEIQIAAQAPINPVVTTGIPFGYKPYLSSVLLGNATTAPLSKIYFRSLQSGSENDY